MEGCHESPTTIITDRARAELWFSIACYDVGFTLYIIYSISHSNQPAQCPSVGWWYGYVNGRGGVADRMCPVLFILCFHAAVQMPLKMAVHEKTYFNLDCSCRKSCLQRTGLIN